MVIANSRPLLLGFSVLLSSVAFVADAFAPVGHSTHSLTKSPTGWALPIGIPNAAVRRETSLNIIWSGKEESNEKAEGKREASSRLKQASLATGVLSDSNRQSIEEFVAPVSNVLDDVTGGWALSYANLEPEDETTPIGISFLATNIAYGLAGSLLVSQGNSFLGILTELACFASFLYHYTQLKYGQEGSRIVRLALLTDYFFALSAILVGSVQLFMSHQLPTEALGGGALAIASLGACWVWEEGVTYIILHSLWHLFSAYTGYIIGSTY